MIIKFVILSTFIFCSSFLYGQNGVGTFEGDSSCYALKFVKKGRNFKERLRMDTYSKSGFYMYENYFYHMRWKGSERYHLSKIIKLSKDSMQLTTAFNEAAAAKAGNSYDTVSIAHTDLEKILLDLDEILGIKKGIKLDEFTTELIPTPKVYRSPIKVQLAAGPKNTFTDCYAMLAGSNIYYLYEKDGIVYRSLITHYGNGK